MLREAIKTHKLSARQPVIFETICYLDLANVPAIVIEANFQFKNYHSQVLKLTNPKPGTKLCQRTQLCSRQQVIDGRIN